MKRIGIIIASILVFISLNVTALTTDKEIKVFLDGEEISFEISPEIINGRTMVPMRAVFEALEAEVNWDNVLC